MATGPDFNSPIETDLTDFSLINTPMLNKGTAFTEAERGVFHLHGLLPPHVGVLDEQVARRLKVLRAFETDFERYAFLRDLQDTNETLFYALLVRNLEEMLPLVYTPTVGEGCQRFSEIWRKPRGVFLSYANKHRIREILSNPRFDQVRVIVVSDGERILGLGDQGAGGMGIPIGKLSLYTGCAGIHPDMTLPILLDVGTNNKERLADPLYVGWRHERVTGAEYDDFVEAFVEAVADRWPDVLLQWEDFAGSNASRLLLRYRDRLCTFNDDIQGTAAVAAGTLLAAINVTGVKLTEQRIAFLGAGSAGCGIASLILQAMIDDGASETEARSRFFMVDRNGLLIEGMQGITPAQTPFVQKREAVAGWTLQTPNEIGLLDVASNAKPTALIGVSGQAGAFAEAVVRAMAQHVERPVIFPLSNPTSRSEATPEQLIAWTDGRALIGSGSPFAPVEWKGRTIPIDQTNNSYIFPGVGLGVLASGARRVTDAMFMAAGKALAKMSPTIDDKNGRLLPTVDRLRAVSLAVANAVARQAQADGVADRCDEAALSGRIKAYVWEPQYRPYLKRD
ncbi:malate dehydrogenase, (decarboxylating, NAD-requiring) (malic enzyme) [Methylocella tundrae]|uniref:Malolactic enzyme n=1 Tax=Methylocella tundrae TaxID=227605 RepID=A0A8B6MCN2_METTU|nr:NAD-dependent malic enzyme [Methylocella tundrae]VTZ28500.1 malate dehydrogenase, (decarboxylating, NAD-requiring) (malic enzyme) [Methylocella tundrae]VTZ52049.1 malate dehydrogenase, (decarboxylating, NAD-requiring) (malic enzyme) [Methylocella tundrae]